MLGFDGSAEDVNALFDSMDPDGSGSLSLDELTKELKRGGGAVVGNPKSGGGRAAAKGGGPAPSSAHPDLSPMAACALEQLAPRTTRMLEHLKEWDDEGTGEFTKREFRQGCQARAPL